MTSSKIALHKKNESNSMAFSYVIKSMNSREKERGKNWKSRSDREQKWRSDREIREKGKGVREEREK